MPAENNTNYSQKTLRFIILLALMSGFFVMSGLFNYYSQADGFTKWSSPDETANYFFTRLYAGTGGLTAIEKYNQIASDIIHPRSFRSDLGVLKPVSFLGMILIYGKLGALTSIKLIPYFTPFFGALGILFFYLLVKEIFGPSTGLVSAGLLAFFPPYFYYSSRSMFHNVLFVVLLVAGFYFAVAMCKKDRIIAVSDEDEKALRRKVFLAKIKNAVPRLIFPALAGLCFGGAIITRTSELLWLGPVMFFAWLFNSPRLGLVKMIVLVSFIGFAVVPVLSWNSTLYGGPLNSGYPQMNSSLTTLASSGKGLVQTVIDADLTRQKILWHKFVDTIFYFGFDAKKSVKVFYRYFFQMFPWLFAAAFFGGAVFLVDLRRMRARQILFMFCWLAASTVLLFYYGSWDFHDNPDPTRITIGNSYTRYWLPIYLGAIVFASLLIVKVTRLARYRWAIDSLRLFIVGVAALLSLKFVLFGSEEGLVPTYLNIRAARAEQTAVLAATPPQAAIITRYHDKILFPERRVIVGLFDDDRMNAEYRRLLKYIPVYYYNFAFRPQDLEYLNTAKLPKVGLQLKPAAKITGQFTLYKLFATSTDARKQNKK